MRVCARGRRTGKKLNRQRGRLQLQERLPECEPQARSSVWTRCRERKKPNVPAPARRFLTWIARRTADRAPRFPPVAGGAITGCPAGHTARRKCYTNRCTGWIAWCMNSTGCAIAWSRAPIVKSVAKPPGTWRGKSVNTMRPLVDSGVGSITYVVGLGAYPAHGGEVSPDHPDALVGKRNDIPYPGCLRSRLGPADSSWQGRSTRRETAHVCDR